MDPRVQRIPLVLVQNLRARRYDLEGRSKYEIVSRDSNMKGGWRGCVADLLQGISGKRVERKGWAVPAVYMSTRTVSNSEGWW